MMVRTTFKLIFVLFFSVTPLLASQCKKLFERIRTNDFNTERGLFDYAEEFQIPFVEMLLDMKPSDHWIDMGAGYGRAQMEYATGRFLQRDLYLFRDWFDDFDKWALNSMSKRASITAVGFERPKLKEAKNENIAELHTRMKKGKIDHPYFSGRYIEKIPAAELPRPQLITDFIGPMSYSETPHLVLKKYLSLMGLDSKFFLYVPIAETSVITKKGTLNFYNWLKSLDGISVTRLKRGGTEFRKGHKTDSVMIQRVRSQKILVPKLKVIRIEEGVPPYRVFQEQD